ncbi:type II 3-dehydroquinate dehydratase [Aquisalinus flavus]|uniref:3-dehydroquinate dehydratase n=1 Tax=Aquisalinus flavus TaxID=1526572 RepID=A0A8J2Y4S8_9PROT|nr:type II 3-dehydroquinate dehydratase [Aquisalinus flavus]MBD0427517.1 type II 3-dehydroquinate dehydratase [Aquisalinus flavus]UNE47312.1 type II 3-dehydroquinate dehydratase [Aquisalinus flavus]GGD01609.1 3-dehydroquinate dehydratase [Aquisalinus flavus]
MSTPEVHILNGPNLNLLGTREPEIYGADTLADIEQMCLAAADDLGLALLFRQTNSEGMLIDWVQEAGKSAEVLIINAAGYTHTSVALHDALKALQIPAIELHLSNIHAREPFRRHSYVSAAVAGIICGFGADGYLLALDAASRLIEKA